MKYFVTTLPEALTRILMRFVHAGFTDNKAQRLTYA